MKIYQKSTQWYANLQLNQLAYHNFYWMAYGSVLFPFIFNVSKSKNTQNENSCLLPILSFNILPKAKFFSF